MLVMLTEIWRYVKTSWQGENVSAQVLRYPPPTVA